MAMKTVESAIQGSKFSMPRPRSINEFIINPRRWKLPSFNNPTYLWHQIKTNLLFFQTNYLIVSVAIFLVLMMFSMKTLLTGIVSAIILIIAALFFFEHIPQARQIKQNHPTIVIICGIVLIIVTWHALHTILIVVGIGLVPLPLWFIHASFRCAEGLVDSKMKGDYFLHTPLGQIMHMVGIDPKPN